MSFYSETAHLPILINIVTLQKNANDNAKPDWLINPPNYLRSAYMEMCESIDHAGYKFWKKTIPDFQNAAMEMVDILHFVVSHEIIRFSGCLESTAKFMQSVLSTPIDYEKAESMRHDEFLLISDQIVASFAMGRPDYEKFVIACVYLGIPTPKLFQWYIGKNALNNFRQANGYKTGSYLKGWFGKEDNDYLIETIDNMTAETTSYDNVYRRLSMYYVDAIKAASLKTIINDKQLNICVENGKFLFAYEGDDTKSPVLLDEKTLKMAELIALQ